MEERIPILRRYLRSVNLSADRHGKRGLAGYVVTPSARQAIVRISESFGKFGTEHAFTLTGPYGTGKSAFALFLSDMLSSPDGDAWKMLSATDEKLMKEAHSRLYGKTKGKPYLVLTITARRASVSTLFAECFEAIANDLPPAAERKIDQLKNSRDTKTSVRLITTCISDICAAGYRGVFFIFDEFGKVFEQARYAGKETDVFLLQELAECASRSENNPFWFLGLLHQSFADYAGKELAQRNEFSKIEGRFESISFVESVSSQIQLTAFAFKEENDRLPKDARHIIDSAAKNGVPALVGLTNMIFQTYAERAFPLHPLTLAAMPFLFRRFGQNERSIFSFLTSNEPNALQEFAARNGTDTAFRLCDIFDYFFENFEVQLSRHPYGHAFLEAIDVLRSKPSLGERERKLIKTIAVLTSLGLQSPIQADSKTIDLAMMPDVAGDCLGPLLKQSILVFRKFNRTFALWSGSDIDLEDCYKNADAELGKTGFSLANTLRDFLPPMPIIAKRHSVEKGALRFFETVYADSPDELESLAISEQTAAAGQLTVCLPSFEGQVETFISEAKKRSSGKCSLVFAIPQNVTELADALMEVRRLNWIEENVRGLRDDRIARREVAIRKAEANQAVTQYQYGLLDPRSAPAGGECVYIHDGEICKVGTNREVSMLFSSICDALYPCAPCILNELINKRAPSSQAAGARRIVINAMNSPERRASEHLGIEGYPPERSIYESVLVTSGMHVLKDGVWTLCPPSQNAGTNLYPVWKHMGELIFAKREQPLNLKDLYSELAKPPYGVLDGLMPILLVAFYVLNRDEVSLYNEGTFLPEPQESHFELMVRRPELFAISGMRIQGNRQRIVARLAGGLQTDPKVLSVVRRLYAAMNSLSKYARETNSVPEEVQSFRRVFFDAKSPERLLFSELPKAFGIAEISENGKDDAVFDDYFNALNNCLTTLGAALPKLVAENRKLLLESCGFENSAIGWQMLYDKASFLLARMGGSDIVPFLQNVVNTAGDWGKADQVMSYIQQAPMDKWGTLQINEFKRNVTGISERFLAACRPFDRVSAALSKKEREEADVLSRDIVKKLSLGKASIAVRRAALIACLEALDKKEADR